MAIDHASKSEGRAMSALAVGLMSGTSLDGVDAALVRLEEPDRLELRAFLAQRYDARLRRRIAAAIEEGGPRDLALLHVDLGAVHASAAAMLLAREGIAARELALIAMHGQTIWHEPGRASLQLGDPAVVAERLGATVVSDFRSRDVAAGGQGAPLVALADAELFGHPDRGRTLLNLGGMANVTWVPRRGSPEGVIAFDTGPGVAVIDALTRRARPDLPYDVDGRLAAAGSVDETALEEMLRGIEFFGEAPPKSTGRERFGDRLAERIRARLPDPGTAVATATELTARTVADALRRWVPPEGDLVVAGGGARNPVLLARIREWVDREVVLFDPSSLPEGNLRSPGFGTSPCR
jgi:anhydro-N-acetylmuramic acid kinase